MAEFTSNAIQEVQPSAALLFTETAVKPNRSIYHREGSGVFSLRGLTGCCQPFARFKVAFSSNIAVPTGGTAGPISAAVAISGEPEITTTMIATPSAVDNYFNISVETTIDVPSGCCEDISIVNTSTVAINFQHSNISIERVA